MLTSETWTTVLQWLLGGGLLTGVAALVKGYADRRKSLSQARKHDVDAQQVLANATVALLGPMTEQVVALEGRLRRQSELIDGQAEQLRVQSRLIREQADQLEAQRKLIATLETQLSGMSEEVERLRRSVGSTE